MKTATTFFKRIVMKFKAMYQAHKIIKGLNEAQQIYAGKKEGKTFDYFLNEIK